MLYAEEDLRIKELKLLTEKYNLERALTEDIPFSERYQDIIRQLEIERSRLQSELAMVKLIFMITLSPEFYMYFIHISDKERLYMWSRLIERINNKPYIKDHNNGRIVIAIPC